MTKLERAVEAAEQLPEELRDQLGEELLHYVDKYLALRDDLDAGIRQLDAGEGIPAKIVFERLKARFAA
jgi:hypothetical protein